MSVLCVCLVSTWPEESIGSLDTEVKLQTVVSYRVGAEIKPGSSGTAVACALNG